MTHVRTQIRDAFKVVLTGIPGVETVSGARAFQYDDEELPAIMVITPAEQIAPLDEDEEATYRRVSVDVMVTAAGNNDVDDELDAIAAQIENRIANATGAPWDNFVLRFPNAAEFSIGDPAEKSRFSLTTRFGVEFDAPNAETIGTP